MAYDYDKQIEELKNGTRSIYGDWSFGEGLFKILSDDHRQTSPYKTETVPDIYPGCLTQIKASGGKVIKAIIKNKPLEEFTAQIVADERIPSNWNDITFENFNVFKEYQLKFDELVNK